MLLLPYPVLIAKGRLRTSEPWRILEVATGQSPDVLAIRLSKEIKRLPENGIQALVPMKRNLDGDPEWIVEHVYVRGVNGSIRRLVRVPGIDFLRPEIADIEWVNSLLKYERVQEVPLLALEVGNFVRVLTGPCARMCGHISTVRGEAVTVEIQMCTKLVKVHTFASNVQVIYCPPECQVFYYQSSLFSA